MGVPKNIKKEEVLFICEKDNFSFSIPYFYEENKKEKFNDNVCDRIKIIVETAYRLHKEIDIFKGIRADDNKGTITAINFIVRCGILPLINENVDFLSEFYASMNSLIEDEAGQTMFLTIYKGMNFERRHKRADFPVWPDELKKEASKIGRKIRKENGEDI